MKISNYELPSVNKASLHEATNEITLFPASAKVGLSLAVNLLEGAIVVLYFYFWLFQRQAMDCSTFPSKGTIFGAFHRNIISKLVFVALILTPAIAGCYLAYFAFGESYTPSIFAFLSVVLAFVVAFPIGRTLWKGAR